MGDSHDARGALTTWKEIAEYLGVSVRAAQSWEADLGLPVHRMPGARRRVWSTQAELDEWKRNGAWEQARDRVAANAKAHPRWLVWSAGALILAAGLLLIFWFARTAGKPVDIVVEDRTLSAVDSAGRRVWSSTLPRAPAADIYRDERRGYATRLFADVDGDGRDELLFVLWPRNDDSDRRNILFCFRPNGDEAWRYYAGHPIVTVDGATILPPFHDTAIQVLRKPRADGGRIVLLSHHPFSWAQQVAVLTKDGRQVAEYWHPGWLKSLALADIDGDGTEEIIMGGVNNAYGEKGYSATLVVLRAERVGGQGMVPPGDVRQIQDLGTGQEAAVLLFPNVADPAYLFDACWVTGLMAGNRQISVVTARQTSQDFIRVHYQLDSHLRVANITPTPEVGAWFNKRLPGETAAVQRQQLQRMLGNIQVLKNEFDSHH